ncbi:MAG: tRNA (cytidine(34)-2'-O)-methyltransferase [Mariprofundaceae bacterium]|nr:tRNA (cytidine(34)-2'-O)-methyltransferase [Mariprofundaceae bacterium]
MKSPLHIVLFEPEIPPNTGNIARLCACTGCQLHLVHPLGFDLSEKQVRRAGLDYWEHLQVKEHQNWDDLMLYLRQNLPVEPRLFGLTTKTKATIWDVSFRAEDVLVFGPETRGLSQETLAKVKPVTIPMRDDAPVRSLNLANACSIVVYEALKQLNHGI